MNKLVEAAKQLYSSNKLPVLLFDKKMSLIWNNGAADLLVKKESIKNLNQLCFAPELDELKEKLFQGDTCRVTGNYRLGLAEVDLVPLGDDQQLILTTLPKQLERPVFSFIEDIIAMVAAQYREPVFAIHNMLGPIKKELEKYECYSSYTFLERIGLKCYQTMRATCNMENYFKYSSPYVKPKLQRVNMNRFMEQTCAAIRSFVGRTDILFRYEVCEEAVISMVDPERLSVAIYNLVANSCLYTNPGNEILIRLVKTGDDYAVIVSDKGVGIPEDMRPHVFKPFYSCDPDGAPACGVGLGLPIVKLVSQLHHGSCVLTSELNRGTTVALRFPIIDNPSDRIVESPCGDYILSRFSPLYLYLADICGINTIETI